MREPEDRLSDLDEAYFDATSEGRVFDSQLLREPTRVLARRKPIVLSPQASVTDAIRSMQGEHRGCVLVTRDGTPESAVVGIFTERDVLFRIADRGRNPVTLPVSEVMTVEVECLRVTDPIASVLHLMSVGGFRHIPIVDEDDRPAFVVSVKDVVEFLVEAFSREVANWSSPGPGGRSREGA
jgi:CBS domain-containing protein